MDGEFPRLNITDVDRVFGTLRKPAGSLKTVFFPFFSFSFTSNFRQREDEMQERFFDKCERYKELRRQHFDRFRQEKDLPPDWMPSDVEKVQFAGSLYGTPDWVAEFKKFVSTTTILFHNSYN